MRDTFRNDSEIPEGMDFLRLVWQQEDDCESQTDEALPKMGKKAPQCIHELGTVLSLLDRLASCFWECSKGDHVVENLAGRAGSFARAALRLMRLGFYDEALVLVRSIGEISNLLVLFCQEDALLQKWKLSNDRERRKEFDPVKVRIALEAKGKPIPMSQSKYARLCEKVAHVTPETTPQNYNVHGRPLAAGYFQEPGVLVTINEVAEFVAWVALCAAKLRFGDTEIRQTIRGAGIRLLTSVGRADVLTIDGYFDELRRNSQIPFPTKNEST